MVESVRKKFVHIKPVPPTSEAMWLSFRQCYSYESDDNKYNYEVKGEL